MNKQNIYELIHFAYLASLRIYKNISKYKNIDEKIGKYCVTEADIELEQLLIDYIKNKLGDNAKIWAEEGSPKLSNFDGKLWIIDPISGTFSFVNNLPHWCLTLAYRENKQTQFSFVIDPSSSIIYWAIKGGGSWALNTYGQDFSYLDLFENSTKNQVATTQKDTRFKPIIFDYMGCEFRYGKEIAMQVDQKLKTIGWVKSYDSLGFHYCMITTGQAWATVSYIFDTFPEFAGELIVIEAGGTFLELNTRKSLRPNTKSIVAAASKNFKNIVESLELP